jgi:hypothetical protein
VPVKTENKGDSWIGGKGIPEMDPSLRKFIKKTGTVPLGLHIVSPPYSYPLQSSGVEFICGLDILFGIPVEDATHTTDMAYKAQSKGTKKLIALAIKRYPEIKISPDLICAHCHDSGCDEEDAE